MNAKKSPTGALLGLALSAFLISLLALYQWMELLIAHQGGSLACAINETFDCRAVWGSAFAKGVHSATHMPLAAWGLVFGLAATGAALRAWTGVTAGQSRIAADAWVARVIGAVGVVACLVFAGVSFSIGAICLTCMITYWLVFAYAFFAWRLPAPSRPEAPAGALIGAAVWTLAAAALLWYPGARTPSSAALSLEAVVAKAPPPPPPKPGAEPPPGDHHGHGGVPTTLEGFVASIPPTNLQTFADGIGRVRASTPKDTSRWPSRFVFGSGPAKMVEFTDIKCGHCARFVAELKELYRLAPKGSFSVEPRQYPLDAECNPTMPATMTDKSGVRCAAAKALICLEGREAFWDAQEKLFAVGPSLSKEKVLEIAGDAHGDRAALASCVGAEATTKKLLADIEYANAYGLEGTPLVLINGREVPPLGAFLYALVLAGGDPGASAFAKLPAPRPEALTDPHFGHGH